MHQLTDRQMRCIAHTVGHLHNTANVLATPEHADDMMAAPLVAGILRIYADNLTTFLATDDPDRLHEAVAEQRRRLAELDATYDIP